LKIKAAGSTHVGMKRSHNEDYFFIMSEQNLFIVADGMGGHSSGEVASKMACQTLVDFYKATAEDDDLTWPYKMEKNLDYETNRLITGIKLANLKIFEASNRQSRYRGMGTTIVTVHYHNDTLYMAHVGDSRIYQLRDGKIKQLTEDHSLLNDFIKTQNPTPEEIANFPHKNVILRALGMKDMVMVDTLNIKPCIGDIYLLCTDGLSGMVSNEIIRDIILQNNEDLNLTTQRLIQEANKAGGNDNITLIITKFIE
jgi:protein phosphatase